MTKAIVALSNLLKAIKEVDYYRSEETSAILEEANIPYNSDCQEVIEAGLISLGVSPEDLR